MAWVQVRPHFEMSVPLPPDTVAVRLRDAVARTPAIEGNVLSRHAQVTIPAEQRRMWSPWLAFEIEETPEGSHLSGVFLPHPNVWTLWFALMAMTGFTAFAAAMYGCSQWMAEQPAWAFWALLPCAAVAAAMYGGALVGQQLGVEEMARLRAFVAEALDA